MADASPSRLRSAIQFTGVLVAALALGWLLRPWVPSPSERFYLLVPPIGVAGFLIFNRPSRSELKTHAWKTAGRLLVAGVACWFYMTAMLYQLMPSKGPGFVHHINGREILIALYFLVAVVTLAATIGAIFDRFGMALARRLAPRDAQGGRSRPRLGFVLEQVLPRVLTVAIALPYLLSAMTVHRMRIPVMATPKFFDRPFEDVAFQASDGTVLRGWFIPAKTPTDRTVLICHGLGANKGTFLTFQNVADVLDANCLFFDFRGHGASDGHTVSLGYWEKLDALAAIEYLRREKPKESKRLIGLGISMGAATLTRAAAEVEPPLDGLILDSCFTSTTEMAEKAVWFLPEPARGPVVALGVPLASLETGCQIRAVRPIDDIARVRCPVLFCHADGDQLVSVELAKRMYEAAVEPKYLHVVPATHHAGALPTNPEAYFKAVVEHVGRKK